jgi:hypothetical protein
MRLFAIAAVLIVSVPVTPALAQSKSAAGKPATKAHAAATAKAPAKMRAKPCAEYGAGFVQVAGSGTCVKIGGYVRMQGSAR